MSAHIFLLSPAYLGGIRAKRLISPRAEFVAAQMYRSEGGVPIAMAFAFMSALYFRGKIAYALHFAQPGNVFVIAPGVGLVPPAWPMNEERMKAMSRAPVDARKRRDRKPLRRDALHLPERVEGAAPVE